MGVTSITPQNCPIVPRTGEMPTGVPQGHKLGTGGGAVHPRLSRKASSSHRHLLCSAGATAGAWSLRWSQFVPFCLSPSQCPVLRLAGWIGCFACCPSVPSTFWRVCRMFCEPGKGLGGGSATARAWCCLGVTGTAVESRSEASPWVSVPGLFSCIAELSRKSFSQKKEKKKERSLDLSGFWERQFEASRAGNQRCQIQFIQLA